MADTASNKNEMVKDYHEFTAGSNGLSDYGILAASIKRTFGSWLSVEGKEVLDLGCGAGELAWVLVELKASHVVGVDSSPAAIKIAKANVPADFYCSDILEYLINQPDASFDIAYACNVFEHLSTDYLFRTLQEISRVLKPSGNLVAMVPNGTSPFSGMTRYWDITHTISFTPSSVRQLQKMHNFSVCECRELGPRPHGLISSVRFILWKVIRFFIMFRLMVECASIKGGVYTADFIFRLSK